MSTRDTEGETAADEQLITYEIEDQPPTEEAVPLGIQHLLTMFLSTAALPLVIARAIGLGAGDTTYILQMAL